MNTTNELTAGIISNKIRKSAEQMRSTAEMNLDEAEEDVVRADAALDRATTHQDDMIAKLADLDVEVSIGGQKVKLVRLSAAYEIFAEHQHCVIVDAGSASLIAMAVKHFTGQDVAVSLAAGGYSVTLAS